jgi:hypothetical protein
LRIASAEEAKSVVRKYVIGTRSRHGKIASILMDEEAKGPDDKGIWTVKGTYVTEERGKAQFTASVTSRGEVTIVPPAPSDVSGKHAKATRR